MLQWLIQFLQGPSAHQTEMSAVHQHLILHEKSVEDFSSRITATREFQRVLHIRGNSLSDRDDY